MRYDAWMAETSSPRSRCLAHQLWEDQMSPVGLVCPLCKQRLYANPPRGRCRSFWESQPGAYSPEGNPCFIYSLMWDDFRIRSLHPPESHDDPRGRFVREVAAAKKALSRKGKRRRKSRPPDSPRDLRPPFSDEEFRDGDSQG
jgi:hypothetical protein